MRSNPNLRTMAIVVLFVFCFTAVPAPALYAGMMETGTVLENGSYDIRARLNSMLQKEEVCRALEERGVSVSEAQARIDALSDAQLRRVAGDLDNLPSGQGVESLILMAGFIFVILLITDIAGFTDIFPFVVKKSDNN